jgi:AcrR family transcriptional regulator
MDARSATDQPRRRSGRPEKPIPRGDLVAIARGLFAARGYAGVSMADVAQQGGLQKSSLFHHFPTKDQLYREVIDTVLVELQSAVQPAPTAPVSTCVERLVAAVTAAAVYLSHDSTRPRLILRELLQEDGDRHYAEAGDAIIETACRFLEGGASQDAWPRQDFRRVVLTLAVIHCSCFALPRPRQAGDSGTPEVDKQHVDGLLAQVRHMIRF